MQSLNFSGYTWDVKNACGERVGPGPNRFSSRPDNVFVDEKGLHLSTSLYDEKYFSSEVVLDHTLGYGEYVFAVESGLESLDKRAVFSGFLYEDDTREIDIEFSEMLADKGCAQYVVQPAHVKGNRFAFPMLPGATTHSICWKPDSITFSSKDLYGNEFAHFEYEGKDILSPVKALMIFNLWLYEGKNPQKLDEVIISSFYFTPLSLNKVD